MKHRVEEVKLSNGAKGLVIHCPGAEVVDFVVEFRAGFRLGEASRYELPHVMEHMMFTNQSYPQPRDFSRAIEKNGAHYNAHTSSDSLTYEYECADFEAERIADLLAVQITQPTFPTRELRSELNNVQEELSGALTDHLSFCFNELSSRMYLKPSLKKRIAQLPTISQAHLRKFYTQTHTADNMRFIVAGDRDFAPLLKKLDVKLPRGERLKIPSRLGEHQPKTVVNKRKISQLYYGFMSVIDEPISYRELIAARIIGALLGHGFSSTLFGLAREKGLIYKMQMGLEKDMFDSSFYMAGDVSYNNAAKFFKLAKAEIMRARQGKFELKHFNATKELLLGSRAIRYQRLSNLSDYYEDYFEDDTYQPFEQYNQLVRDIKKPEAIACFDKLFSQSKWGLSLVGPVNSQQAEGLRNILAPLWR